MKAHKKMRARNVRKKMKAHKARKKKVRHVRRKGTKARKGREYVKHVGT